MFILSLDLYRSCSHLLESSPPFSFPNTLARPILTCIFRSQFLLRAFPAPVIVRPLYAQPLAPALFTLGHSCLLSALPWGALVLSRDQALERTQTNYIGITEGGAQHRLFLKALLVIPMCWLSRKSRSESMISVKEGARSHLFVSSSWHTVGDPW